MEELLKKAVAEILEATTLRHGATSNLAVNLSFTQARQAVDSARKILANSMPAETFTTSPLRAASLVGMAPHRAALFQQKLAKSAEWLTAKSAENAEGYRHASAQRAKKLLVEFDIATATADAIIGLLEKEEGS